MADWNVGRFCRDVQLHTLVRGRQKIVGHDDVAEFVAHADQDFVVIAFVFGFTTVFVSLGATASAIGQLVAGNLELLSKIAGVAIIVVGLHFVVQQSRLESQILFPDVVQPVFYWKRIRMVYF